MRRQNYKLIVFLWPLSPLLAQERSVEKLALEADLLWLIVGAYLVFVMQPGFAFVEAGFTRAKNAVSILMKNISDFMVGSLVFYLIGFSLMFGPHLVKDFGIGFPQVGSSLLESDAKPDAFKYGFFFFQLVFAATAATIVSGAMAERTRFYAYLIFSAISTGIIYPIFGSLAWSNLFSSENVGFLAKLGFTDFAGSTVVHSVGGWMGLAGAMVVGPRHGKYTPQGVQPILGHNLSLSVLGMFLLWFGWFGFNPASTATIREGSFAIVAVTTNIAAAAGGLAAMAIAWILFRRPDASMVINGVLAGLVAITAPCYNVNIEGAILIGLIAGVLVVFGVILFDTLRIDDPVGAISVHGLAGAWGTLAVGLFADPRFGDGKAGLFYGGGFSLLGVQALGVLLAFVWAFGVAYVVFLLLKKTIGLRVEEHEELEGLDVSEHGNEAYATETYQ
ncbi:MAG: ammonium transporter [Leptospiraceae bacterium]|nr:ammonium transporter [Leptospiraceae bacterium]MDW8305747.1 ammonium transporter [Leptospiraceae bacterium]